MKTEIEDLAYELYKKRWIELDLNPDNPFLDKIFCEVKEKFIKQAKFIQRKEKINKIKNNLYK